MKQRIFFILPGISIILLLFTGCKKEKEKETENQQPTISFLRPQNNIIIKKDTIISISIEASDKDGVIEKVEFYINGNLVNTLKSAPYQIDYDVKYANKGSYIIKAIAYDNDGSSSTTEINFEVWDHRTKYLGNFIFKIVTRQWMMGYPDTYDTSYYTGVIRKYVATDSQNDLCSNCYDDAQGISIEFNYNKMITSGIYENGSLSSKSGYHYSHSGGFLDENEISFGVYGLGGLGAGYDYNVKGTRIK